MLLGLAPPELLFIALALALGGFLKGVTGIGMPVVVIPVMAMFMGIEAAVIVMAIPGVIWNGWLAWRHRDCYGEVAGMTVILVTGTVSTVLGVIVLYVATERFLSLLLLAWIMVYVLSYLLNPEFSIGERARKRVAPWIGLAAGVFQGATGISAPVLATYFHALRLRPDAYVFAVSAPFTILGISQSISFAAASMFTRDLLLLGLLSLVPAALSIPVGVYVRPMINRVLFDRLILCLIALMGLRLAITSW